MLFNVAQLLRGRVGDTRRSSVEPEPPLLHAQAELVRTPGGVLVRLDGAAAVEAVCSRCVAPFCYSVPLDLEEVYREPADGNEALVTVDDEDDGPFIISEEHLIDITEAVRQYTEMAAAMQPLCRDDCPGLCPGCGEDLTIATCGCDRRPIEPRWAALAGLSPTSE